MTEEKETGKRKSEVVFLLCFPLLFLYRVSALFIGADEGTTKVQFACILKPAIFILTLFKININRHLHKDTINLTKLK